MKTKTNRSQIQKLAIGAIMTALVVVLQLVGSTIRLGPFSISLVLIPIVIGAAMSGIGIGSWLGLVFGVVVLLSGDASAFLALSVPGAIITCIVKGVACGAAAGLVYKLLEKKNRYLAVIVAAIVCPIVNTGVFLLCSRIFFFEAIKEWGLSAGYENVVAYMFLGLVGGNFLVELASNIVLSPIVVCILNAVLKRKDTVE